MTPEEIQGYLMILSPLAMSIVAMSIFTLQDKMYLDLQKNHDI